MQLSTVFLETLSTQQWVAQGLGYFTALLAIVTWLPQCMKVIKTKNTKSISAVSNGFYFIACLLNVIYGFLYYFIGKNSLNGGMTTQIYLLYSLTIIVPYLVSFILVLTFFTYKVMNIKRGIDAPEKFSFGCFCRSKVKTEAKVEIKASLPLLESDGVK